MELVLSVAQLAVLGVGFWYVWRTLESIRALTQREVEAQEQRVAQIRALGGREGLRERLTQIAQRRAEKA